MPRNRVIFSGGPWWLGALLLVVAVQIVVATLIGAVWNVGPAIPVVDGNALAALLDLALVGVVWWFLRKEGVRLEDIGLSTGLVGPAIGVVAAFYLVLNAVVIGLGLLVAGPEVAGYQWSVPPARAVAEFLYVLAVAGIVEELVFRGYVQSKVISLVGSDTGSRLGIGIGIAVASVLFAASHIARVLASGAPGTQAVAGYGTILVLSGVGYGIVYELTQNLYVPMLVHAAGNMPGTIGINFFDTGALPAWAGLVYPLVYLALFGIVIVGYRQWGVRRRQVSHPIT